MARTYVPGKAWRPLLVAAVVFLCSMVSRGPGVDRMVSPDEKRWLTHSANFYRALTHGELGETYQIGHPGVTVMWVGTVMFLWRYPTYPWEAPGQVDWHRDEVATFLWAQGREPVDLLASAHFLMAITISLVLAAASWWAVRLFGIWTTGLGLLLLAADPFHIALSRLLHLDGLTSAFALVALLALLCYLYRGDRRIDLIASGVAAGLAILTKSPALFLVPFTGLVILMKVVSRSRAHLSPAPVDWGAGARSFLVWSGLAFAVFVALWPAMWVQPLLTGGRVLAVALGYAVQGHEDPLYFRGRIFEGDPGWEFYPVSYLWRTTPSALTGLALAALAFLVPRSGWLPREHRRPLAVLLLFAVLFATFMSLGSKKFDRYILAVYPPLLVIAGAGWSSAVCWLRHRLSPRAFLPVVAGLVAAVLGVQAGLAVGTFPYFFSYYNPLLGGTTAAPAVMMVGWGEGLDQVARYLNSRKDVPSPRVMIGVWGGTFSYYFKGRLRDTKFGPGPGTLETWDDADFAVVYINQWQRHQVPEELMTYLAGLEPVFVLRLNGLIYGYVYDIRDVPPPDYLRRSQAW